jgi:CRISPR-associated protein Cas1
LAGREGNDPGKEEQLRRAGDRLAGALDTLRRVETLDAVRGCEGDAARTYFEAFNLMIRQQAETFAIGVDSPC